MTRAQLAMWYFFCGRHLMRPTEAIVVTVCSSTGRKPKSHTWNAIRQGNNEGKAKKKQKQKQKQKARSFDGAVASGRGQPRLDVGRPIAREDGPAVRRELLLASVLQKKSDQILGLCIVVDVVVGYLAPQVPQLDGAVLADGRETKVLVRVELDVAHALRIAARCPPTKSTSSYLLRNHQSSVDRSAETLINPLRTRFS